MNCPSGKVSLRETLERRTSGDGTIHSGKRIKRNPVFQIVSKPGEAGLKRSGGARERLKFSAKPETEASGLCDDEGP